MREIERNGWHYRRALLAEQTAGSGCNPQMYRLSITSAVRSAGLKLLGIPDRTMLQKHGREGMRGNEMQGLSDMRSLFNRYGPCLV